MFQEPHVETTCSRAAAQPPEPWSCLPKAFSSIHEGDVEEIQRLLDELGLHLLVGCLFSVKFVCSWIYTQKREQNTSAQLNPLPHGEHTQGPGVRSNSALPPHSPDAWRSRLVRGWWALRQRVLFLPQQITRGFSEGFLSRDFLGAFYLKVGHYPFE